MESQSDAVPFNPGITDAHRGDPQAPEARLVHYPIIRLPRRRLSSAFVPITPERVERVHSGPHARSNGWLRRAETGGRLPVPRKLGVDRSRRGLFNTLLHYRNFMSLAGQDA